MGQNWGKAYLDKSGRFIVVGVLENDIKFLYEVTIIGDSLTLVGSGNEVRFFDSPANDYNITLDRAFINGNRVDEIGVSNFYEVEGASKPWEELDLKGKVHYLFSTYTKWLNVEALKSHATKLKEANTPQLMEISLDSFVK